MCSRTSDIYLVINHVFSLLVFFSSFSLSLALAPYFLPTQSHCSERIFSGYLKYRNRNWHDFRPNDGAENTQTARELVAKHGKRQTMEIKNWPSYAEFCMYTNSVSEPLTKAIFYNETIKTFET